MNSKTNIAEYKEEVWEIDWLLRFFILMSELVIKRKHYLQKILFSRVGVEINSNTNIAEYKEDSWEGNKEKKESSDAIFVANNILVVVVVVVNPFSILVYCLVFLSIFNFQKNLDDEDNERNQETKDEPDIDEFQIRSCRQDLWNALVHCVHDKHDGQGQSNGKV